MSALTPSEQQRLIGLADTIEAMHWYIPRTTKSVEGDWCATFEDLPDEVRDLVLAAKLLLNTTSADDDLAVELRGISVDLEMVIDRLGS